MEILSSWRTHSRQSPEQSSYLSYGVQGMEQKPVSFEKPTTELFEILPANLSPVIKGVWDHLIEADVYFCITDIWFSFISFQLNLGHFAVQFLKKDCITKENKNTDQVFKKYL